MPSNWIMQYLETASNVLDLSRCTPLSAIAKYLECFLENDTIKIFWIGINVFSMEMWGYCIVIVVHNFVGSALFKCILLL